MGTDKGDEMEEVNFDPGKWLIYTLLFIGALAYATHQYKVQNLVIAEEIRANEASGALESTTTAPLCYLPPCSTVNSAKTPPKGTVP
jgi:hypothetical protein